MDKRKCFVFAVSLCVTALFIAFWSRSVQEPILSSVLYKRHISYGLTVKNNGGIFLKKAELWIYAPANDDPDFQFTASQPVSLERDTMGNRILHFVFYDLPPFAIKVVNIDAEVTLRSPPGKQKVMDPILFLQAEPMVQIENPELIALARQLHHEESVETLRNIYHWLVSNLKKGSYVARERGAIYAVRKKEGDCTEFMQLSLALCRINNIPARGVSGHVITANSRLAPNGLHDWAEVYLNGAWQIFDPFNRVLMEREEEYLVMYYHNPKKEKERFSRWKTSDSQLQVTMTK